MALLMHLLSGMALLVIGGLLLYRGNQHPSPASWVRSLAYACLFMTPVTLLSSGADQNAEWAAVPLVAAFGCLIFWVPIHALRWGMSKGRSRPPERFLDRLAEQAARQFFDLTGRRPRAVLERESLATALLGPYGPTRFHRTLDLPYADGTTARDHGHLWIYAETMQGAGIYLFFDGVRVERVPLVFVPCLLIGPSQSVQMDVPVPGDPRLGGNRPLYEVIGHLLFPGYDRIVQVAG